MVVYAMLGLFTIVVFLFLRRPTPPPVLGIYRTSGVWFPVKIAFIYSILQFRKLQSKCLGKREARSSANARYGLKSQASGEDMDCRQPLSAHPKAIDAVYFNTASCHDWNLVVGAAHRPQGVVDGFLYLKVPGLGVLQSPKLPDTLLNRKEDEGSTSYGAEGLCLTPVKAMSTWRIQYHGIMKLSGDEEKTFRVELDAEWNSDLAFFNFDTDMDCLSLSRGMALEPWSREYFHNLKVFHQTHYEQHGDITGTVTIAGERHNLMLNGVRDHSYAEKREWKNFHRYALHFITLDCGLRISVGVVCVPLAFSRLELGYVYLPSGKLLPVRHCDLQLHQHGETATPPLDYGFRFQAGGKTYEVQVEVQDSLQFFVGWEWEARIVENLAHFTVNGVKGWGATEWQYRHMKGRERSLPHAKLSNKY